MSKRKKEPQLHDPLGNPIVARYKTSYFYSARLKEPDRWTRGYPRSEEGGIMGAGRVIMLGRVAKIQFIDRTTGEVEWTLKRGPKVPGTHLYEVIPIKGAA